MGGLHSLGWVDAHFGGIDGDGGFGGGCGYEFNFAVVGDDIAGGVDAGAAGFHVGIDFDGVALKFEVPVFDGAHVCDETEIYDDMVGAEGFGFAGFVVFDGDVLEVAVGVEMEFFDFVEEVLVYMGHGVDFVDGVFVGAEFVAAVDEADLGGESVEVYYPVEGAVSAADDDDGFVFEEGFVFDEVV